MKTQHTPGPWKINEEHPYRIIGREEGKPYNIVIAETCGYKFMREQNARLIATAPELLRALEQLLDLQQRYTNVSLKEFDQARTAIAKAKGVDPC
jgi:hypothetical protein